MSEPNTKTVSIFTEEGDVQTYLPLSQRIPMFRRAYPADSGYRVEIQTMGALDVTPGMARLYEKAIENGHNPSEVGLPGLPTGEVIFRASLISPDGIVLESGSARREVVMLKDWEKGETAARQRLLAALGFAGEVFDDDEDGDITDQGHRSAPSAKAQKARPQPANNDAHVAAIKQKAVEKFSEEAKASEPEPAQESVSESQSSQPVAESPKRATGESGEVIAVNGEKVPAYVIRQIDHHAKVTGRHDEIPEQYDSIEHAKSIMKGLMQ